MPGIGAAPCGTSRRWTSSRRRGASAEGIMRRAATLALAGLLVAVGCASLGSGLSIRAKAEVGQVLLHRAWRRTQADGAAAMPWPWADTHPVARLAVPARGVDLFVLAGASGRTLAWGPGHLDASAPLGGDGNAVVSAHRDTHFRFLRDLAAGERLIVDLPGGARRVYRVREAAIIDARLLRLTRDAPVPTLTLVTCYPFDAIAPGGSLRYVVTAAAD
jgi:sortase A